MQDNREDNKIQRVVKLNEDFYNLLKTKKVSLSDFVNQGIKRLKNNEFDLYERPKMIRTTIKIEQDNLDFIRNTGLNLPKFVDILIQKFYSNKWNYVKPLSKLPKKEYQFLTDIVPKDMIEDL